MTVKALQSSTVVLVIGYFNAAKLRCFGVGITIGGDRPNGSFSSFSEQF